MRLLAAWFALLMFAGSAFGYGRDPAFEAMLDSTLRARSPEAESLFHLANRATEENKPDLASELYARVTTLVPDFGPAYRRRAYAELALGHRIPALASLDSLIAWDPDPFNLLAKANGLMSVPGNQILSPDLRAEVRRLLDTVTAQRPDEVDAWRAMWRLGMDDQDWPYARRAMAQIVRIAPDDWETWSMMAFTHITEHRLASAESALARGKALQMPGEVATGIEGVIGQARAIEARRAALWVLAWALIAWAVTFAALSFAGLHLSRKALEVAGRTVTERTGQATGADARLRTVYQLVLRLCCALFYISIPLVLIVVLGLGGGLIYVGFVFGHVPIKLVFFILIVTLVSAWSIVRSLIAFRRDEDPGEPVDLAQQPVLRQLLDRVAEKIGTRPVDDVFLTPGTEIAVYERGGIGGQLAGGARRCLILGIGVLDGMTVGQLKSILAHEYGHFSNRDTAGGGVALSVRRSVTLMALHLARGGAAAWYNPAWWFVRGFHALFLRISQGASRLQEVLADRWAAFAYGSAAFTAGFTHVIEASVRFDVQANAAVREALQKARPLSNLYRFRSNESSDRLAIHNQIAEAMTAEPSPYDSHPSPAQRLAWVAALAAPADPDPGDDADAWSLLAEREDLERFMTAQIRQNVATGLGVEFKEESPESGEATETPSPAV